MIHYVLAQASDYGDRSRERPFGTIGEAAPRGGKVLAAPGVYREKVKGAAVCPYFVWMR